MKKKTIVNTLKFGWSALEHYQQVLSWIDAAEAREARQRAELLAELRFQEMLDANPSGQLGNGQLNDKDALKESGLL